MESKPSFGRQFSMWYSTKLFSSIFDLGPLTPKIYSPKFYRLLLNGAAIEQTGMHTCVMAATGNRCTQRLACGPLWGPIFIAMATTFEVYSPTGLFIYKLKRI